ncbi:MAG TPA: aldo/keto reductase, partial [Thermoanaerobaculia bacterium]|nr:aldo/keto reductase [Thermoanaerobaculia bacterium]
AGGALVDSSPMYGRSEEVIGQCLRRLPNRRGLFSATKVWTPLGWHGRRQIAASEELWSVEPFDLLQVHNLLSWEAHLETLRELKAAGGVRYLGVTTSHGRRHQEMERVIDAQPLDFVQLTYNLLDREAEARLLPLAAERGLAVIVNRPFRRGALIDAFGRRPLPPWAGEIDCRSWPQLLLKFVVSHPTVTCAIPATSRPEHMAENMAAARGRLPDAALRQRLIRYVEGL